jgi:hypothetical protein
MRAGKKAKARTDGRNCASTLARARLKRTKVTRPLACLLSVTLVLALGFLSVGEEEEGGLSKAIGSAFAKVPEGQPIPADVPQAQSLSLSTGEQIPTADDHSKDISTTNGTSTADNTPASDDPPETSLAIQPLALGMLSVTEGSFTLSATESGEADPVSGTDYTYASNLLTIISAKKITITLQNPGTTTTDTLAIGAGTTTNITLDAVSIESASSAALDVQANATLNLTLKGSNSLKSGGDNAGLQLRAGVSVVVNGGEADSLVATAGYRGAGIGGGDNTGAAGAITINGGTLTATGGTSGGAGIGGGYKSSVGNITISRATITATSTYSGAGIGGGTGDLDGSSSSSSVGDIIINGGTIKAAVSTGGGTYSGGAGIGAGLDNGDVTGDIIITGAIIERASSSSFNGGAGIGGGVYNSGVGGDITITDTIIEEASGGRASDEEGGAGIGGGTLNSGVGGKLIINSGTIYATTQNTNSQDIGNGCRDTGQGDSDVTALVIDGGSVWAANNKVASGGTGAGPQNSAGKDVYANKLTLGAPSLAGGNVPVTSGVIDGVSCASAPNAAAGVYGIAAVRTGSEAELSGTTGKVCLWLSANSEGEVGLITASAAYERTYARPEAEEEETLVTLGISGVTPTNSTPVERSGIITLSFTTAMDTAKKGSVVLKPSDGTGPSITLDAASGLWNLDGTVYSIPYSGLLEDTTYSVDVSNFASAVLKALVSDSVHSFTTLAYTATITPLSHDFGSHKAGYATLGAQSFVITNTGATVLHDVRATLDEADALAFEISSELVSVTIGILSSEGFATTSVLSSLAVASLAPGEKLTISARPKTGLSARAELYRAVLVIDSAELSGLATASLSVTVTKAGGGGGGGGGSGGGNNGTGGDTLPLTADSSLFFGVLALFLLACGLLVTSASLLTCRKRR